MLESALARTATTTVLYRRRQSEAKTNTEVLIDSGTVAATRAAASKAANSDC